MPLFRRRPVIVEAHEVTASSAQRIADWCGGAVVQEPGLCGDDILGVDIPYDGGSVRANLGDYIVREEKTQFSVMTVADFASQFFLLHP